MSSQLIIPGLFKEVYVAGSRHSAGAPELIRSNVDDDNTVSFEWKAVGSSVYTIIAKGSVTIVGWDVHGHPKFDSFEVECSCPDGERQRTISQQRGKLYVCKHAKAALDSVVDPNGKANFEAQKRGHMEEATRQKRLQEEELPGERARIEHGLSKRSADEIVTIIKERVMTVEGLEALVTLFPPDVMPAKTTQKCGRCKKEYDPNIQSELICRLSIPSTESGRNGMGPRNLGAIVEDVIRPLALMASTRGASAGETILLKKETIALRASMCLRKVMMKALTLSCWI